MEDLIFEEDKLANLAIFGFNAENGETPVDHSIVYLGIQAGYGCTGGGGQRQHTNSNTSNTTKSKSSLVSKRCYGSRKAQFFNIYPPFLGFLNQNKVIPIFCTFSTSYHDMCGVTRHLS